MNTNEFITYLVSSRRFWFRLTTLLVPFRWRHSHESPQAHTSSRSAELDRFEPGRKLADLSSVPLHYTGRACNNHGDLQCPLHKPSLHGYNLVNPHWHTDVLNCRPLGELRTLRIECYKGLGCTQSGRRGTKSPPSKPNLDGLAMPTWHATSPLTSRPYASLHTWHIKGDGNLS